MVRPIVFLPGIGLDRLQASRQRAYTKCNLITSYAILPRRPSPSSLLSARSAYLSLTSVIGGWSSLIPWPRVRGSANPPCCLSAESIDCPPAQARAGCYHQPNKTPCTRNLIKIFSITSNLLHNCRKQAHYFTPSDTKGSRLRLPCRLRVMDEGIPSARVRCDTTDPIHLDSMRKRESLAKLCVDPQGGRVVGTVRSRQDVLLPPSPRSRFDRAH